MFLQGLKTVNESDSWSEVELNKSTTLALKLTNSAALTCSGFLFFNFFRKGFPSHCSKGYHPQLTFECENNFDGRMYRMLQEGGILDGPIKYPSFGKVASILSPDGVFIGLIESTKT